MFGRARTIRALKEKVRLRESELWSARLNEGMWRTEAEDAQKATAEWQRRTERLVDDRIADSKRNTTRQLTLAGAELAKARRLGRAVRGCARYRQEIAEQQATIAERDATIARLQQQVDDADVYGDRALLPAQPTPEVERLRRENRRLNELVTRQQEQLSAHQAASIAADRARPKAVAA